MFVLHIIIQLLKVDNWSQNSWFFPIYERGRRRSLTFESRNFLSHIVGFCYTFQCIRNVAQPSPLQHFGYNSQMPPLWFYFNPKVERKKMSIKIILLRPIPHFSWKNTTVWCNPMGTVLARIRKCISNTRAALKPNFMSFLLLCAVFI